ncbi:MAG TPA: crosslink repair DNA glycosylase YcaQ family protein [Vicinamibacterales bacterium]|nr:crosslink repair DNA glycosylase YcaQ family protein [Vicinamibacterales bacterium]
MSVPATLSAAEARRLALASLGFAVRRPGRAGLAHVRATASRLGAIQIDSVNVVARAHYLPTFSRYGPYPMAALDALAHEKRELFEYWGHAACFLPLDMYPLLRWRMENQRTAWASIDRTRKAYMETVYREVAERGPISAGELSIGGKSTGPWWGWSEGKHALELLFRQGRLAVSGRRHFVRLYDLIERVLPAPVLAMPVVPPGEAKKRLIVRAARAMGVGTAKDIAQYFHIDAWWDRQSVNGRRTPANTGVLFDELVEDGRLERVSVEGWRAPAFVVSGARVPPSVDARAIVSPFDPILWERGWTKAVFGFEYQIEIYVPAPRRIHGYYVLPFLYGDRFAARVDLKADRPASTLIVQAAYVEPGFDARTVAGPLARELRVMAAWLSLARFDVRSRGGLARPLTRALESVEEQLLAPKG